MPCLAFSLLFILFDLVKYALAREVGVTVKRLSGMGRKSAFRKWVYSGNKRVGASVHFWAGKAVLVQETSAFVESLSIAKGCSDILHSFPRENKSFQATVFSTGTAEPRLERMVVVFYRQSRYKLQLPCKARY